LRAIERLLLGLLILIIPGGAVLAQGRARVEVPATFHSEGILAMAVSPNGRLILTGGLDNTARLWDVATGHLIRTFVGHLGAVSAVAFSNDGRFAMTGSADTKIQLWEVATGQSIRTFSGHSDAVASVVISRDGRFALSGGRTDQTLDRQRNDTLILWDVATGRKIRGFDTEIWEIRSVALSPDGRLALSGDVESGIKLWDVGTGRKIRSLEGQHNGILSVAFSTDGRTALSGAGDATIKVWDVATGRTIRTIEKKAEHFTKVTFSADRRFALVDGETHYRLLDLATGNELRKLRIRSDLPYESRPTQMNVRLSARKEAAGPGSPSPSSMTRINPVVPHSLSAYFGCA
jgi:WD40 repeat protein